MDNCRRDLASGEPQAAPCSFTRLMRFSPRGRCPGRSGRPDRALGPGGREPGRPAARLGPAQSTWPSRPTAGPSRRSGRAERRPRPGPSRIRRRGPSSAASTRRSIAGLRAGTGSWPAAAWMATSGPGSSGRCPEAGPSTASPSRRRRQPGRPAAGRPRPRRANRHRRRAAAGRRRQAHGPAGEGSGAAVESVPARWRSTPAVGWSSTTSRAAHLVGWPDRGSPRRASLAAGPPRPFVNPPRSPGRPTAG